MTQVKAKILEFFVRKVVELITEKYGFEELQAIRSFIFSETYQMLKDYDLGLYQLSYYILFDLWESEQVTGDPRNSIYIRDVS